MRQMRWLAALLALCLMIAGLPAALAEDVVPEPDEVSAAEEDIVIGDGIDASADAVEIEGLDLGLEVDAGEAEEVQSNAAPVAEDIQPNEEEFEIYEGALIGYHGPGGVVVIPKGVKSIAYYAFDGNKSITDVVIPGTVKEIGESAFAFCENLETVTIEQGTETISADAFEYCESLCEIIIPKSVTFISPSAFLGCDEYGYLTIYGFRDSYAEEFAEDYDYDFEAMDDIVPKAIDLTQEGPAVVKTKSTLKLAYAFKPAYASSKITWTSSDETIATVSAGGKVTGVSAGVVTITATTENKKSASVKVTVYDPNARATTVKFVDEDGRKMTKLTLYTGQIVKLGDSVVTEPFGVAAKRTWKSKNKKIATVSSTGKLVAQKPGKTSITVKVNGAKAKLKVTVKKNKLDKINSKPKMSAISYGQDIWLKSIEIAGPKKIVCEYYLLFKRLPSMTTTKFSWIEASAFYYDDDYNTHEIFNGTVKNIKVKTKGQKVKKFKVTFKGRKVKNSNLILKNLKGKVRSSEDFWLNWVY